MSIPTIQPKALFGLRTDIIRNVFYITDHEVLYPAAAVLILHNYSTNRQKYIKLMEKSVKTQYLAISPKRTMCAIIENIENPQIIIYDLNSLKRKRTLNLPPDAVTRRIECIDFSYDEKYIMALSGDPDWMMYAYNWERGKIETSTRANYVTNPGPVSRVICSPADNANVLIYGNGLFRLLNMQETVWRQYGFQKADHLNITSCCFLGGDRVLIGTHDGLLLLIDIGELKFTYEAAVVKQMNPKAEKDEEEALAAGSATLLPRAPIPESEITRDRAVRAIIAFSRGFAYSCGAGTVYFFEKVSNNKYVRRNIYKIEEPDYREIQKEECNIIRHLAFDISETYLLATTNKSQIYHVKLWGLDYAIAGEVPFQILGESYHSGEITSLTTCVWKPIFMTCGSSDRTVRIWNYDTEIVELTKQYQEDIHSVSLHPTGLFAAIGFSDKLRFMTVMIDDLQVIREMPIRESPLSCFGNRGHLLAAVNRDVIQVFSCVTFHIMTNLKGHNAKITGIVWSNDDKKLVSCGKEGALYEWDMTVGKRVGEVITKGVAHNACCLSANGDIIYVVSDDGCIREISNSNILRKLDMNHADLTNICLSRSNLMMFVSSRKGAILSVKMPLVEPVEYSTFQYHHTPITVMRLSLDDQTLLTSSYAGVVGIWKLLSTEGKIMTRDKDFSYFSDILISQNDLEEKLSGIKDLTQRTHELEMEHAYQMRHIESLYKEKIKDVQETYTQAIDELKINIETLEVNHNTELNNINIDMNVLKERHEVSMLELEAKYNAQLIVEYDKYMALEGGMEQMIKEYEVKLEELEKSKETTIEEMTRVNESKLFNLNKMLEESLEENDREIKIHEAIITQIENDSDREIQIIRTKYEEMLKNEKETNIRLRGETGVLKKKFLTSQMEINASQMEILTLEAEQQKFKQQIRQLEKEIFELKKEISERDLTIQEKERRIYDLKRRDQELERFKLVLNYKIKEQKNQIEPRDREITEKREQIGKMELELEKLLKTNSALEISLSHMREKLANAYKSVHTSKMKYHNLLKVIKNLKIDIYDVSGRIQDFRALKDGVRKMYLKYITDKEFIKTRKGEEECQAEFARQRDYLEEVVRVLRSQAEKDREVHYGDNLHFMETNWSIMDEIYKIRKELKTARRKVEDMEALLCFRSSKLFSPRKAQQMVKEALRDTDEIEAEAETEMEKAIQMKNLLKEEVERLNGIYEGLVNDVHLTKRERRGPKDFITFSID